MSACDRVVVATDAREIAATVERAGFEAVMTSPENESLKSLARKSLATSRSF